MDRPFATIIAGPNGSGKSTIIGSVEPPGESVNADNVARSLNERNPEDSSLNAGRLVVARLRELVKMRQAFNYETTLSSKHSLSVVRLARAAGYEIGLVFVFLKDVDLCVQRVKDRVLAGGHDIPEAVIRRRYDRAYENLSIAVGLADSVVVHDNSEKIPMEVLRWANGKVVRSSLDPRLPAHRQVERALTLSTTTIAEERPNA